LQQDLKRLKAVPMKGGRIIYTFFSHISEAACKPAASIHVYKGQTVTVHDVTAEIFPQWWNRDNLILCKINEPSLDKSLQMMDTNAHYFSHCIYLSS
jgi:hypothetical protein